MEWNKHPLRCALVVVLTALISMPLAAQISLTPTIVFLPSAEPIGRITLRNNGAMAQEVSLEPVFGYPISNSEGRLRMEYDDTEMEAAWSLRPYLKVFPRRFVLEPGGMQNVRLEVTELGERPDGLYWTRLHITSNEVAPDVEKTVQEGIGTRLNYRVRQDIGVHYLHGQVSSALDLTQLEAVKTDIDGRSELVMHLKMTSGGNSPYIGTMQARLVDEAGAQARIGEWLFSVFGERYWPQGLDVSGLPPGRYRLELLFLSQRGDVASTNLPTSDRVVYTINVDL